MAHKTPSQEELTTTLTHLQLSTKTPLKPLAKPKSRPVAESWDQDSGSDTEAEVPTTTSLKDSLSPINTTASYDSPNPPPPTPASPTPFEFPPNVPGFGEQRERGGSKGGSGSGTVSPARRPEKTTAVAGRLIAGALGVRAPKRTEEEREFDRAVREKERRRRDEERNREKREKEAAEARKRAVWED